jgi:predicted DNA-binding transcriptional regulator YafY
METYKLDRQFVTMDDLFYIITALSGIEASMSSEKIAATMEKMKSLLPGAEEKVFSEQQEKLYIDFSMLGGTPGQHQVFKIIEKAVEAHALLDISYTNNRLKTSRRVIEPMTIVFQWRSWYLFAFCRLRNDYRLFRLSRIQNPVILEKRFLRKDKSFHQYLEENDVWGSGRSIDLVLAFDKKMKPLVEEYYNGEESQEDEQGRFIVHTRMPEDGWVYGMILSYGTFVEVLAPEHVRKTVGDIAGKIGKMYA